MATPPKWTLTAERAEKRAVPFWPAQAAATPAERAGVRGDRAVTVDPPHGAPLESPADPASSYVARPEWYAIPLFELRMFFEGPLEIRRGHVLPGIATGLAFGLPFLDRGGSNTPGARKR